MTVKEAALVYVNKYHLSVFPVILSHKLDDDGKDTGKIDKIPLGDWHQYRDRLPTEEELAGFDNPRVNGIGIPTGNTLSGITILDWDSKEPSPYKSPVMVKTISGGLHIYYKYKPGVKNAVKPNGESFDIRGEGGYVVLPPSAFDGGSYKWILEGTFAEAIKKLPEFPDLNRWIEATVGEPLRLEDHLKVAEGSRNDKLYRLACSLLHKHPKDEALQLVEAANEDYQPPLSGREVATIFQSAFAFIGSHLATTIIEAPVIEQIEPNNSEDFKTETLNELLAANLPKAKWLIKDILPIEGFCFIFGPEATGKTFYTLTLAKSVAYGDSWLEHFPVVDKTRVLIIDKENTRSTIQARLRGLSIDDPDGRIHRVLYPEKLQIASDKGKGYSPFILELARKVRELNIGLLVIDSFTDVMVGNANAREETQVFFDSFRSLFPGICILALAHSNKAAGFVRTSSEKLSGNRNLAAQLYTSFFVEAVPKTRNEFTFEQTKSRDGARLPVFKINLVSKVDFTTGESHVEKVMYAGEVVEEDVKAVEAITIISDLLNEKGKFIKKDLRSICKEREISDRTISRAIAQMETAGTMVGSFDDPPNANRKVYSRPVIEPNSNYWDTNE